MFVDQTVIHVQSGNGGAGCVSFRREKYVPKGGPDGGNGGKGGDVIVVADTQLHTLLDHRYNKTYKADSGDPGSSSRKTGRSAKDIIVKVPCGTVVKDAETGELLADLVAAGQEYRTVVGGRGGRGNAEFKTATNQTPRNADPGEDGQERSLLLELKLIADIGLVGFPNAGKSTLISVISAARPKVADYPFTTLEPNIGIVRYREYDSFSVADIPGLIEGAHLGKGLGTQFLRHIERTAALVILVDCLSEDYDHDLAVLRSELHAYSPELASKPYIVAISKMDTASEETMTGVSTFEQRCGATLVSFSSVAGTRIPALLDAMWTLLQTTRMVEL